MSYPKLILVKEQMILNLEKKDLAITEEAIKDEYEKSKALFEKEIQAKAVLTDHREKIYTELEKVFNSSSSETATADYFGYLRMFERPDIFSNVGLVDGNGDALDTNAKITAYASAKIEEVDQYIIFREKKKTELALSLKAIEEPQTETEEVVEEETTTEE